jgi:hypothetical protein
MKNYKYREINKNKQKDEIYYFFNKIDYYILKY